MILYLLVFALSTYAFYCASKLPNSIFKYILIFIGILIPSLLAAFRDLDVGIDVLNYVEPTWYNIKHSHSLHKYLLNNINTEPIYLLLNYIVALFTDDIHIFFFIHMALLLIIATMVAYKINKGAFLWYFTIVFLLYLYNNSLSMMRQSIAILIGMYASIFLLEKKILKFYILVLIAFWAHSSAIFLCLLHPLLNIIIKFQNKKLLLTFIIISATIALNLLYNSMLIYFIDSGILSLKYTNYIDQEGFSSHKIDLLLIFLMIIIIFHYKNIKWSEYFNFTLFFLIVSFCITTMGSIVEVANRLAYYFIMPSFISACFITNVPSKRNNLLLSIVGLLLFRYIYLANTTNIVDTIPYSSKILGI